MTTITNFLHTNFLTQTTHNNKQTQQHETPIWVLSGSRDKHVRLLRHYMIEHCCSNNKVVVRLDFGVGVLREVRGVGAIWEQGGLGIVRPIQDKPYYVITLTSQFRKNTNTSIPTILKTLKVLPSLLSPLIPPTQPLSLLIQGLQIITTEQNGAPNLQSFINHIPSLNPAFKQITVFKSGGILAPEHVFALERISTCLTEVQEYEGVMGVWGVTSTVRRLTGFSNQEKYTITMLKNGKLKVQKWVAPKPQQQTQSHKQLVNELGFKVNNQSVKTEQLKKMIYPHLRMQSNDICKCNKKQCKSCSTQEETEVEGLIILDDEQEDDDDIDV